MGLLRGCRRQRSRSRSSIAAAIRSSGEALAPIAGSYENAHDIRARGVRSAPSPEACSSFRGEARRWAAWVWRIALRVALDERRRPTWSPLEDDEVGADLVAPARDPGLSAALRDLPPRRRLIFFLRYFADLSYSDIASVCDISEGTVAAVLAQARAAIAKTLEEDEKAVVR